MPMLDTFYFWPGKEPEKMGQGCFYFAYLLMVENLKLRCNVVPTRYNIITDDGYVQR